MAQLEWPKWPQMAPNGPKWPQMAPKLRANDFGRGCKPAHQCRDAPEAKGRGSQKRRSLLLRPPPPTRRRRRRQRPSSRRPRCRPSHAGFAPTCATQDPNSRCGCRLSWFQKSLKQAVATEIQQKAEAQTDVLETKMAAVMAALV